jgi:GH18 family chitinase
VITWVPHYLIDESKQQLSASFDGVSMADGLSYLALQFWLTDGPSARLSDVSEGDVTWFHDWARQRNVKILLCVHNNTGDWNWPEAVRSFKDNRDAFVANLVSQVMSRDFDGVDLDLEGIIEPTADDQESYRLFVEALSKALRPLGKKLTLDSFHGQWNAPNWDWWPALLPLVDGITSMGYEQSGMGVDYQVLVDHAASAPKKLMIGVPSYHGTWLEHTVGEQLGWIQQQGQIGTAIWDASLRAPEWRQRAVWEQLKAIKSR